MPASRMCLWSTTVAKIWAITLRELKDRKWSLLAYCLGSLGLLWLYVATFQSALDSAQQLQQLLKTYPKALLDALGMNDMAFSTIEKYLNAKHFSLMWPLLAIILMLSRAGNQIAGEVQSGTMGLLLALPLERGRIFAAKYLAGLITIIIFAGVSVFGVIPFVMVYNFDYSLKILFFTWVLLSLFMWAIYSVGLAASSWFSEKGPVFATVSTILIVSYVANLVALINDNLSWLKHYSLFYYFNTQAVVSTGHIGWQTWLVFGGTIAIATALAAWRFVNRDFGV